MDISERLRDWRKRLKLRQKEAARLLVIDVDKYRRFEYGTQTPKGDDRDRIDHQLARHEVTE